MQDICCQGSSTAEVTVEQVAAEEAGTDEERTAPEEEEEEEWCGKGAFGSCEASREAKRKRSSTSVDQHQSTGVTGSARKKSLTDSCLMQ